MDQAIRNKLRGVVTQCRKLLEDSVSQELQGKFGIYMQKAAVHVDDDARMTQLNAEERAARKDILDHFDHIKARGFKPKDALDQLTREIAYTHLNRFCAYKMMEARQVYVGDQRFREAVSRGVNSNGVKFYLADHPDDERLYNTGRQDVAYRHFLDWLGALLSEEIGVLFNPNDSANRLYPTQKVLDEVLALLNDAALAEIWTQDETIGWVYQYFTPKELRDQARKESAAPRNSYELAFRNQFFTPRYVVEFLTDNTLGRIWYEMRKGDTKLKDQCRYMVRRPNEVFLAEGQQSPKEIAKDGDDLAQEELLKQPVYIPHRPKKDPRELKILDPACGSGHFLLYCFDLLLTVYEEAYDDPDLGPSLKTDYPTLADLKKIAPSLILSRNLHGIDIDLRATQIAALAVWLRCQRAYQDMGLKRERPKITRSNIVCAEPMPGEKALLDEFLKTLREDRLEALIRRVMQVPKEGRVRATQSMADTLCTLVQLVWDKMQLAGEAGSLLKIEEELQGAIRKGQEEWEEKQPLFRVTEFSLREAGKESYFRFVPGEGVSFWERAESLVMAALHDFANYAGNGKQLQRRLFVEDAVQGFAFVDLCRQQFDVVLMNPPFGESSRNAKDYITLCFPDSYYDLFSAFVDRGSSFLSAFGRLGAITSRTGFFLSRLERWRRRIVFSETRLHAFADLGQGVLDTAMVETAAYVVVKTAPSQDAIAFFNLLHDDRKPQILLDAVHNPSTPPLHVVRSSTLEAVPGAPLSYWASPKLRTLFKTQSSFVDAGGEVKQGLATGDDFRFLRLHWEVPTESLGRGRRWIVFCKGGEYQKYYYDPELVVDWSSGSQSLYQERTTQFPVMLTENAPKYVFRRALTYPQRTQKGFNVRQLPEGSLFGAKGPAVFPPSDTDLLFALGVFNSRIAESLIQMLTCFGSYNEGYVGKLPYPCNATTAQREAISSLVMRAVVSLQQELERDETSHLFVRCECEQAELKSAVSEVIREVEASVEGLVSAAYGLELQQTSKQSNYYPSGEEANEDEAADDATSASEPLVSYISYVVGIAVGRFDVRYATGELSPPPLLEPLLRCRAGLRVHYSKLQTTTPFRSLATAS
jgi:hypothetical protein